jgi:hypothetical protein
LNEGQSNLICALADGRVMSIGLKDISDVKEIASLTHPVMHFAMDEREMLFMTTSNSDIMMMDLKSKRMISHRPFDNKIRSMTHNQGNLFIAYEPSLLHIIPVNQEAIKAEICELVDDDFSVDQWNEVVGENIPKKSILCK